MLIVQRIQSWILLIAFLAIVFLSLIQVFSQFGLIGFFWSLILNDSFERFYQNPVNLHFSLFLDMLGWLVITLFLLVGVLVSAHLKEE